MVNMTLPYVSPSGTRYRCTSKNPIKQVSCTQRCVVNNKRRCNCRPKEVPPKRRKFTCVACSDHVEPRSIEVFLEVHITTRCICFECCQNTNTLWSCCYLWIYMMLFIHGALIYRNSHFSFDSPPPLSNQKIVVYFFFFFLVLLTLLFIAYNHLFIIFFSIQFLLHGRQAFYRLLFISCPYIHVLVLTLPFCVTLLYMHNNNVSPSLISITMVTS